mgnify:CR=1 FL=1
MKIKSQLYELAKQLVQHLNHKELTIAFAESMTGGMLSGYLTEVPNASKVIKDSIVVYSNQSKIAILNCDIFNIRKYTVYSEQVIDDMIHGLRKISNADILVAISGVAGPDSDEGVKPGHVWMGIYYQGKTYHYKQVFTGNRTSIRNQSIIFIYNEVIFLTS